MIRKVDWFSRGRDAFTEGRPCFIRDGRISGNDRSAWYAGWNHQSRINGLANLPAEERANLAAAFADILTAIRSLP